MTPQEKSAIKSILQSPQWRTIERLAEIMRNEIKEDSGIREEEFATLKAVLTNEGKRQGIKEFIERLYNETI